VKFPARFGFPLLAAACFIGTSTVSRLLLALRSDALFAGGAGDWTLIFAYGLAFDLVTACYVTAPMVLWLALVPDRVARSWPHRVLSVSLFAALVFGGLLLAISEWLFWDEFGSRFNFIAVDYLLYTHEVLGNIWQSYPVGKVLIGLVALALAWAVLLRRMVWESASAPLSWRAAGAMVRHRRHPSLIHGFLSLAGAVAAARAAVDQLCGDIRELLDAG